jgi:hypothetical protein
MKFSLTSSSIKDISRQADKARDAQLWEKAASLYQEYLEKSPDDVGILIQAGINATGKRLVWRQNIWMPICSVGTC